MKTRKFTWGQIAFAFKQAALGTRVVAVFGEARPHHADLFAIRHANRMKMLVHDGIGMWLAARRLNSGKFVWPRDAANTALLSRAQFEALVLGLPWQRLADGGVTTVVCDLKALQQ